LTPNRAIQAAKLAAEVEVYYRLARIKSIATTHLYVAAGLAIKNGRWNELRQLIPRRDTVPGWKCVASHASGLPPK